MYVCLYVCFYLCVWLSVCVCMAVCMCVCMCAYVCVYACINAPTLVALVNDFKCRYLANACKTKERNTYIHNTYIHTYKEQVTTLIIYIHSDSIKSKPNCL